MRKSPGRSIPSASERIRDLYREHAGAAERFFAGEASTVEAVAAAFVAALKSGGTLLFFGNGGSAADAQHLAAEVVNRFAADRPALAPLALTTHTPLLTRIANDARF